MGGFDIDDTGQYGWTKRDEERALDYIRRVCFRWHQRKHPSGLVDITLRCNRGLELLDLVGLFPMEFLNVPRGRK